MSTRNEIIVLFVGLLVAGTAALALPRLVAPFQTTFSGLGMQLPVGAALLLEHTYLLWLLPVAVLAVWLGWPNTRRRVAATYVAALGGTAITYAAVVIMLQ